MIRFSKYIRLYFILSALVIVPGIISLLLFGLRPSIDFSGGTLVELGLPHGIGKQEILSRAQEQHISFVTAQLTGSNTLLLRLAPNQNDSMQKFLENFREKTATPVAVLRNEVVGPTIGNELLQKALIASLIAGTAILLYVGYAFKNIQYGVSAVLALIHDILVVMSVFSLLGHFFKIEVDTLFVTAVLTTMSFSVHDTIVVFDRIREMVKIGAKGSFEELADLAMNQTIARSLANSLTIIVMLLSLVLMGGESIKWFAVALLIGTISGTYSSPFIATPVLILLKRWERRKRKL